MSTLRPQTSSDTGDWTHPLPADGLGLYVHVPFCETKCPYCDFNTYSGIERLIPSYMSALRAEIRAWGEGLSRPPLESVFFGGGTPSYLPAHELASTLSVIRESFVLPLHAEITIEANPDDANLTKAERWLEAGINRISIGVQSFDDNLLTLLGRRHDAEQAATAFQLVRSAGFENASLDLMYALPGQSIGQWRHTLERALELEPSHISLYSLQIEPGTPFDRDVQNGRMSPADDDLGAEMYELAMDHLARAGFHHYEISNWSLPGSESRHNLLYWRNRPYVGVGPGAHSSLFGQRFANMKSPRGYVAKLKELPRLLPGSDLVAWMRANGAIDFHETTTRSLAMSETMMMGLRLVDGVTDETFRSMFGIGLRDRYESLIEDLVDLRLAEWQQGILRLTRHGKLLGNEVFARFVEQ